MGPSSASTSRSTSPVTSPVIFGVADTVCGVHRIIKDSSHQIELGKPQVVIDAVDEVLRELHTGAKP
jgi:hypothetical protein